MKALFAGSRKWLSQAPIEAVLRQLPPGTVVVHGGAPGVDNIAGDVALRLGFEVRVYPALAKGRQWPWAGPARNQDMLDEEHPSKDGTYIDRAYLFHEDPLLGKGTRDMKERLDKARPLIEVVPYISRRR